MKRAMKAAAPKAMRVMKKALQEYKEKTKDGFDDTAFGQCFAAVNTATGTVANQFELWDQVGVVKLKEVKEAAAKFTSHSSQSLNDAIWQQVALEKAEERAALASRLSDKFKPIGNMMMAETGKYKESANTAEDFKQWNTVVLKGLDDIKSDIETGLEYDAAEKKEAMVELNKALDKMEAEGEFATKLTRFASAWGRSKLGQDLFAATQEHRDKVAKDMQTYHEQTSGKAVNLKSSGTAEDKLFGQTFGSISTAAITLTYSFQMWTDVGKSKIGEISEGNEVLKPYEKA